jgi:outer membrane lipoprotein-sorting protein
MNRKRTALSVAATGTAAGVVGLVLLASPAGAGSAPPALPPVSPEALVQSVLTTKVPAFAGTVQVKQNLGLPLPILPTGGADGAAARVFTDGAGKFRVSLDKRMSETTITGDGSTVWIWDSADRSVRKIPHDQADATKVPGQLADPSNAAAKLVSAMQADSNVAVDGTSTVAGRPVYQLLLTPKPTEKTLLREVRVAIDSELRVPLRLEVLANGQADPALDIAFSEFKPGTQDASLFQFTPPAGAKVTESKPGDKIDPKAATDLFAQLDPQVVGTGWDTVLVAKIPANVLSGSGGGKADGPNAMNLLRQIAKPVNGSFGQGWVISTKVATALITADGRAAIGAVPQQVLIDALGHVK